MCEATSKFDHVTEEGICLLVDAFYAKVREDPELGPVFARAISDWDKHLTKMYSFWSSVMLMTGRYKGNPMMKHLVLPDIRPEMFARWLALFDETCTELFDDDVSDVFRMKAERIAESLKRALSHRFDSVTAAG
jgi:hemoglobin